MSLRTVVSITLGHRHGWADQQLLANGNPPKVLMEAGGRKPATAVTRHAYLERKTVDEAVWNGSSSPAPTDTFEAPEKSENDV